MAKFKQLYEASKGSFDRTSANEAAAGVFGIPNANYSYQDGVTLMYLKSKVPMILDYSIYEFAITIHNTFSWDIQINSTDIDIKPALNSKIQAGLVALVEKAGFKKVEVREFSGRVIITAKDIGSTPEKTLLKLAKSIKLTTMDKIFAEAYGKTIPMKEQLPKFIKAAKLKATEAQDGNRKKYVIKGGEAELAKFRTYMDTNGFESNSSGPKFKTWLAGFGRYVGARIEGDNLVITHYK